MIKTYIKINYIFTTSHISILFYNYDIKILLIYHFLSIKLISMCDK